MSAIRAGRLEMRRIIFITLMTAGIVFATGAGAQGTTSPTQSQSGQHDQSKPAQKALVGAATTSATTTGSSGPDGDGEQAGQSGYEGSAAGQVSAPSATGQDTAFRCERIGDETARARCEEKARRSGAAK